MSHPSDDENDDGFCFDYDPDSAWIRGKEAYFAYLAGVPPDNPYPPGTIDYIDWQGGFNDARADDAPVDEES